LHAWQASKPSRRSVMGVILFSPYLYTHIPPAGTAPQFVPVTGATSVPLYIFQSEKNATRWHFPAMLEQLQAHAPVYSEILSGVTSLFYDQDDASETQAMLDVIAARIKRVLPLLAGHDYPLTALPLAPPKSTVRNIGLDAQLKPYRGNIKPTAFKLKDAHGSTFQRDDFKGQVTIVNFWASWCPPCVEEIPSLNRLRRKMQGRKFQLISINYAETPQRIKAFMDKVAVDFPVLIDPEGRLAGQWRVVAFPSTFVIGPDGQIKYAVNAAIHWDTPEVLRAIDGLLH